MTLDDWKSTCPLRAWRLAKDPPVTQEAIARTIKKSVTTVALWERGALTPSEQSFNDLILIIGNPNLPAEWSAWQNQAPSI